IQSIALVEHLTIPVQAIGLQRMEYVRIGSGEVAGGVQIFHTHQPDAALMTGVQITGEGSDQRAEMQEATGGGSEAAYVTGGRHGADSAADSAGAGCLPGERCGDQPPICFSLISARVLQSMHRVAVGRASRRRIPISTPQESQ